MSNSAFWDVRCFWIFCIFWSTFKLPFLCTWTLSLFSSNLNLNLFYLFWLYKSTSHSILRSALMYIASLMLYWVFFSRFFCCCFCSFFYHLTIIFSFFSFYFPVLSIYLLSSSYISPVISRIHTPTYLQHLPTFSLPSFFNCFPHHFSLLSLFFFPFFFP